MEVDQEKTGEGKGKREEQEKKTPQLDFGSIRVQKITPDYKVNIPPTAYSISESVPVGGIARNPRLINNASVLASVFHFATEGDGS